MKKSKIEVGQCYEKDDHVWMVIDGPFQFSRFPPYWHIQNTFTKEETSRFEHDILTWRRPFENYG